MTRLMACEARKLLHSRMLLFLLAATVVLTGITITSPESGGPLFMKAGGNVNTMGAAIGFIGNYLDPQHVAASAIRTSFLSTPFWLPVVIMFTASVFSEDFATRSIALTKAKGGSPAKVLAAKAVGVFAAIGVCYAISCLASFLFKASQYGATVSGTDAALFIGALSANVLLLWALAAQTMFLFCVLRNSFASALSLLLITAFVLVAYPASYTPTGETPQLNPLFMANSAYYLAHTCSLSFDGVPLVMGIGFGAAATAIALAGSMVATNVREV